MQVASDPWDALEMGLHRTWRTVKVIYQTLYATIFRQISARTDERPAVDRQRVVQDRRLRPVAVHHFIGLININSGGGQLPADSIADGGHMVFLIYEKIRGKPAPEKLQEWAMWGGLAFILLSWRSSSS